MRLWPAVFWTAVRWTAVLWVAGFGTPAWPQQPPADSQTCVDVQIGSDRSYGCLNAALQRLVTAAHRPIPDGALGVGSPTTALGLFNETATHERLGLAFGHSIYPQRPPSQPIISPLFPPAGH